LGSIYGNRVTFVPIYWRRMRPLPVRIRIPSGLPPTTVVNA